MRASNEFCGMQLIEALNEDIERELRIADEHIARALSANSRRKEAVRSHSCACAAAAMRHATTLAAEVLHLGGVPPPCIPRPLPCSRDRMAQAADLFRRYRQRLKMANDLGLLRLEEALREIIQDLRVCSRTRNGMFRLIRIS
jgi:bacterioferritin (cytochrome b1)